MHGDAAAPRKPPSAGRLPRRVAIAVLLLAVAAELTWIVAARIALGGESLRSTLNNHPEELFATWRSGVSWFPGRVRLEAFTIRGQDERDQWYGEADHADLVIRLLPLLRKEIVGTRVHLNGVSFRIRARLDAVPPGSVDPANLPPLPGFENPPSPAPATNASAPTDSPEPAGTRHWAIRLHDIRVAALRQVWVDEMRLEGHGLLRGRLDYVLNGPFETEVFELSIPSAFIGRGPTALSTNLAITASGILGPLLFRECHGAEYFRRTTAQLTLRGDIATASILSRHLGPTESMEILGDGEVDTQLSVRQGLFQEPSRLKLLSPALSVRLGDAVISGDSEVEIALTQGPEGPVSTLTAALRQLRLRHRDSASEAAESGDLVLRATAYDPVLASGFKDVAIDLRVGPLLLPNSTLLNPFIPAQTGGSFVAGQFRVVAEYARERDGTGHGRIQIDGEQLGFKLGARDYAGTVGFDSAFDLLTNRVVSIQSASVSATNVQMTGLRARQADGWHARIDIDSGTLATDRPDDINLDLRLHMLDTRPLLALLRENEDAPRWVRLMPTLKDLHGSGKVRIDSTNLLIRDLKLRGAGTEVLAQLAVQDGNPDGILYARYGLVALGLDFRGGESDWTVFGAKRKYLRALADLHLENAALPEGDNPPDDPR